MYQQEVGVEKGEKTVETHEKNLIPRGQLKTNTWKLHTHRMILPEFIEIPWYYYFV